MSLQGGVGTRSILQTSTQDSERSRLPLFALFVDCVYQLMQQQPCEFEYSDTMLLWLYACAAGQSPLGSLLGQDVAEYHKLQKVTASLADFASRRTALFNNTAYHPISSASPPPLSTSTAPGKLIYWQQLHDPSDEWSQLSVQSALYDMSQEQGAINVWSRLHHAEMLALHAEICELKGQVEPARSATLRAAETKVEATVTATDGSSHPLE